MRLFLKLSLVGLTCIGLLQFAHAQGTIPDGDFESWSTGSGNYEEPSSGWFASLNPLVSIGGPETVEKTTDAYAGTYAAKLTTKQYGSILVPGLLVSGEFDFGNSPSFLTRGRAFTDRPATFRGWYKFTPANGDSAAVAVQLTRYDNSMNRRDTIGEVGLIIRSATSTWTEFVLPLFYYSGDTPDSIIVVATSSADGANFRGEVGSELLVDELELEGTATAAHENSHSLPLQFEQAGRTISLVLEREAAHFILFDLAGKTVQQRKLHPGENRMLLEAARGLYLIQVTGTSGRVWQEKLMLW